SGRRRARVRAAEQSAERSWSPPAVGASGASRASRGRGRYRECPSRTLSMRSGHAMRIAVHAFEGITLFHLAAPLLVFGEVTRRGLADDWTTVVFTDDGRAVHSAEGVLLDDVHGPEAVAGADLLVLPSWPEGIP